MAEGPRLLVRSAPRLRLGSLILASERQRDPGAVRNSPFTAVILATAAFLKNSEEHSDTEGRNIDSRLFCLAPPR
jgi:hypothetical protein